MRSTSRFTIPWACCLIAVLVGCSSRNDNGVTVRGNVTLDGKPLESGIITFLPIDGKGRSASATIVDGKYVTLVAPGEKKVSILAEHVIGTMKRDLTDPKSATFEHKEQYLPVCYNTATTLKATISTRDSDADFALRRK